MVIYTYEPLDTSRRETRLCTIFPGSFDDAVVCKLNVVSLDDKPEYESLSYAWGSPILNKEFLIKDDADSVLETPWACGSDSDTTAGGHPAADFILPVTTNLYTAFRYLRRSDQTRVVCIFDIINTFLRPLRM